MRCQAFIFARGGSKGVPRKNIRLLGGKPLIAHAIGTALAAPSLGDVIVSTDDEEIAETARQWGARVPFMRPEELASDTASEWHAWRHAVAWAEANEGPIDAMVSLPTTAPFRSIADVEASVSMLRKAPAADVVIAVSEAERNPYFNMVTMDSHGKVGLVIPPRREATRRQDAPQVYDISTVVYAVRARHVREKNGLFDGSVYALEIPRARALDIDTPYDFHIAELLAANGWPKEPDQ